MTDKGFLAVLDFELLLFAVERLHRSELASKLAKHTCCFEEAGARAKCCWCRGLVGG